MSQNERLSVIDFIPSYKDSSIGISRKSNPYFKQAEAKDAEQRKFLQQAIHLYLDIPIDSEKEESLSNRNRSLRDYSWSITRLGLTEKKISQVILRSPAWKLLETNKVVYLQEKESGEVVLFHDLLSCKPPPSSYAIILKPITKPVGLSLTQEDSFYEGGLKLCLCNFPRASLDGSIVFGADQIQAFIRSAVIKNDREFRESVKSLENVQVKMLHLQQEQHRNSPSLKDRSNESMDSLTQEMLTIQGNLKTLEGKFCDQIELEVEMIDNRLSPNLVDWSMNIRGDLKDRFERCALSFDWTEIALAITDDLSIRVVLPSEKREKKFLHLVELDLVVIKRLEEGQGKQVSMKGKDLNKFISYQGNFLNGKRHGYGILRDCNQIYVGEFENDLMVGTGQLDYWNGTRVIGNFKTRKTQYMSMLGPNPYIKGEPHGHVTVKFNDGSTYVGDMEYGKITGKGKITHASGEEYNGQFLNGLYHGSGTWISADGKINKTGKWSYGVLHGESTLSTPFSTYTGMFEFGLKHGKGIETTTNKTFESHDVHCYGLRCSFGETTMKGNRCLISYEGPWLCDRISSGGMKTVTTSSEFDYTTCRPTIDCQHENLIHNKIIEEMNANKEIVLQSQANVLVRKRLLEKCRIKHRQEMESFNVPSNCTMTD